MKQVLDPNGEPVRAGKYELSCRNCKHIHYEKSCYKCFCTNPNYPTQTRWLKGLRVDGKTFLAHAFLYKTDKGWLVVDIAPYLAKITKGIPIEKWGEKFRSIGASYSWFDHEEPLYVKRTR